MVVRDHGSMLQSESSILLVVDVQEAFRSIAGFQGMLPRVLQLVSAARALDVPIVGTELTPNRMGSTIEEVISMVDSRLFVPKESFSSLQVQSVASAIEDSRARSVVLIGCETHLAVLQTALQIMATFDCEVHLVADCTASRRERDRELAMGRLQRVGVQITSLEMVLFEWLRDTRHPRFAAVTQKPARNSSADASSH